MINGNSRQHHYRFIHNEICEECPSQDWPIPELNKIELAKYGIKIEPSDVPTDAVIEKSDIINAQLKFLEKRYVKVVRKNDK